MPVRPVRVRLPDVRGGHVLRLKRESRFPNPPPWRKSSESSPRRHANGADAGADFSKRAGCNDGLARTAPGASCAPAPGTTNRRACASLTDTGTRRISRATSAVSALPGCRPRESATTKGAENEVMAWPVFADSCSGAFQFVPFGNGAFGPGSRSGTRAASARIVSCRWERGAPM